MVTILSDTVICHTVIALNVICTPCKFYRSVAYASGDIRILVCCRTYGPPCTWCERKDRQIVTTKRHHRSPLVESPKESSRERQDRINPEKKKGAVY